MCCEKKNGKEKDRKTSLQIIRRTFPKERKKERKNVFCDEGVGKARAKEAKRKRDEENPEREREEAAKKSSCCGGGHMREGKEIDLDYNSSDEEVN